MDLPRFLALDRHWSRRPPLRDMVQAYLGIRPAPQTKTAGNEQADLDAFIELFQAAGGRTT
jgi:hypothetical protein